MSVDACSCEVLFARIDTLERQLAEIVKDGRRRKKRPRSAYQEFLSTCMKEQYKEGKAGGEAIKVCAAEWRERKKVIATV